ncbi:hypothetical protein [Marinicauda pacifica]|uniref:hypothetical protein n=1 Tax=Marinicauda pacifica TaxID=1133559 RepID=UPI0035C85C65
MMKVSALGSASVLALALGLTACGSGDTGTPGRESAPTEVTLSQAEDGLAALNLVANEALSWEEQSFEDGVYTFTNLTYAPADAEERGFTIEELVIAAPRVTEAGHVAFDRLNATGIAGDAEGPDQVEIARVYIDAPGPGLAALIGDVISGRADAEDYTAPFQDIAEYSFDGLGVDSVSMTTVEDETPLQLRLGALAMDSFDGETLSSFVMDDFAAFSQDATQPVRFSLDEVRAEGLKAGLVQALFEGGESGMEPMSDMLLPVNMYSSVALRGLNVDADGVVVTMEELTGTSRERGGELVQVSEMPLLRVAAREGTQAGDQVAGALEMLGYEAFDFSMRGESVYDAEADRMYTRGENYLRLEDGFEIRFDQDFSGIEAYMERYGAAMADMFDPAEGAKTPDALSPAQMDPALKAAYEPLMLNRMRIAIEDRSLLDRALDAAATRQNVDPATVRSQMIGMLGMGVMMAPPEIPRPLVGSVSQALTLFLQEGGTVVISADPEEPVSIGRIIEASEEGRFDPAMLNVTVRHEGEDEE